jgi:hypothetical protein
MPLLSHTTAGAGGSGRLLESQPEGGKEHCEPIPPTPSADHNEAVGVPSHYGNKSGAISTICRWHRGSCLGEGDYMWRQLESRGRPQV